MPTGTKLTDQVIDQIKKELGPKPTTERKKAVADKHSIHYVTINKVIKRKRKPEPLTRKTSTSRIKRRSVNGNRPADSDVENARLRNIIIELLLERETARH